MYVVCVLCLTAVPLPPGENPFALKINNNNNTNNFSFLYPSFSVFSYLFLSVLLGGSLRNLCIQFFNVVSFSTLGGMMNYLLSYPLS
jgi:hypothetical protein